MVTRTHLQAGFAANLLLVAACGAGAHEDRLGEADAGIEAIKAQSSDWEAESFAREREISVEESRFRLQQQQRAGDFGERASAVLGDRFGGVWIDVRHDDRVTVGVVDAPALPADIQESRGDILASSAALTPDAEPSVASALSASAQAAGIEDYTAVPVAHSFSALERANEWLTNEIVRVNADGGPALNTSIRTDLNSVELGIPVDGELSPAQRALSTDAQQKFGGLISVATYAGHPQLDSCIYPFCDPPLRAGVRIYATNGTCTGAFIVKNSSKKLFQLTAGHCAQGDSSRWWTRFENREDHYIGAPVSPWLYGNGNDLAMLTIDNPMGWTPQNWVFVSQSDQTTADEKYAITSVGSSTVGMRICISGGWYGHSTCGHVTALSATHTNDGQTFTNLGKADYCRVNGDSGAPVFASHAGYGVHHGGDSDCVAYYSSLRSAEVKLNVQTLTSSQ